MLRPLPFVFAAIVVGTAASADPVTTFDCTPTSMRLRGLHMVYSVDLRGHTVHESMRNASGAPYLPNPRGSAFREQTRAVEFDGTLVMWSVDGAMGPVNRILDRTSNILTISEPVQISGHPRVVDTHVPCVKQKPALGFGG